MLVAPRTPRLVSTTLVIIALALIGGATWAQSTDHAKLAFDGEGYYAYLPAWLIDNDATMRTLYDRHFANGRGPASVLFPTATGGHLDKYPAGVALCILPLFLVARALGHLGGHPSGGYGGLEQAAIAAAMVCFGVLGCWCLARVLLRYCGPVVVAVTLVAVVFGTDLFHYATYEPAFSHVFAFAVFACLLALVHRWCDRTKDLTASLAIGFLAGLLIEIRYSDAVLLFALPVIGVDSLDALRSRARLAIQRWREIAAIGASAFVAFLPQFLAWHAETGRWVVNSYQAEHLDLSKAEFGHVLFSFGPHGVLPWEPILALVVVGLPLAWWKARPLFLPMLVVLPLNLWVIASWHQWWYGGGFGLRPFADSLPLMAFALASVFAAAARARVARWAVGAFAAAAIVVTLVMMSHYWAGQIYPDGISADEYLRVLVHGWS